MADPIIPAVEPATTPAAPTTPAAAPASNGDEELKFSKTAFEKRLDQAKRSERAAFLAANGFKTEEEFTAFKTSAEQAAKEASEKRKAEMTELERLKTEIAERDKALETEKARAKAAAEELEMEREAARLRRLYLEAGITSEEGMDFAEHLLVKATDALAPGETLDEVAFIAKLVKDPVRAAQLGIKAAPVVTPASTTNPPKGPPPKVPTQAGDTKHASQETDAEWAAWKRSVGVS